MMTRLLTMLAIGAAGLLAQSQGLTGIIPSSVAAGTPSFQLQLNGGPFCTGSYAVFQPSLTTSGGALSLPSQVLSTSQMIATVPANLLTQPRTAAIFVNNDSCDRADTNSVSFSVGPAIEILPSEIQPANVGSQYFVQFSAMNGNGPYNFVLLTTLNGFTLDFNTGNFTGTPTQTGDIPFTIQATDRLGAKSSRNYVLHVDVQLLDISTQTLARGIVGVPYDQFIRASGGLPPYVFSMLPSDIAKLPPGLSFKPDGSGEILGTPTVVGTYVFAVSVQDANRSFATRNVTLIVDPPRPVISPDTIPFGNVNVLYTQAFTVTGGTAPYTWSLLASDSDFFTINASTGVLTGTATAAGTYNFTVQVADRAGLTAQKRYTLAINAGIAISTPSLPDGVVGTPYTATLTATGATGPFTWTVPTGPLPDGLTLDASTGRISGTPTKAGAFNVEIRVSIASGSAAVKRYTITITAPVTPPTITNTSLPDAFVGRAYTATLTATGGTSPYTFAVVARTLPAGLTLDTKTGIISGTPTTAGTLSVGFGVTDSAQLSSSKDLSIRVVAALTLAPASPTLPAGTVGVAYTQTFTATGGVTPYKFTATLPTGFTLDSSSGVLTGTPAATDALSIPVTVTDALGTPVSRTYTVAVNLPSLPTATIGGLPATSPPAQQPNLTLSLGDVFPVDVTGTLTLTFASAVGGSDDTVQFTTGGRTATFRIPAGTRNAIFTASTVGVVTGTVAGTITVTATLNAGGANVTPTPAPVQRIVVDQGVPVLTRVVLNTTATGFEVLVTGYTTTRSMVRGTFTFAPTSTGNLQTTTVQVPLDAAFLTWFNSAPSNATGGQFTLTMPFTASGPSGAVSSVSVVLTNARGDSASRSPQWPKPPHRGAT